MISLLRVCFCALVLSLFACQQNNPELQEQLVAIQTQLDQANASLKAMKTKARPALVHSVFFKLKSELSETEKNDFMAELKRLAKISYTKNLFVATPAATGDGRLRADYDVVLQMHFAQADDLAKYQAHELHLEVKAKVGPSLAAKPFVYDYWQK